MAYIEKYRKTAKKHFIKLLKISLL